MSTPPVPAEATTSNRLEVDTAVDAEPSLPSLQEAYVTTDAGQSDLQDFKHVHGRRFHGFEEGAYFLPNDAQEAGRLDLQHHTWKITYDGLPGRVPITDHTKTILDVGTGTGIWAVETATAYPHAKVIGTDLSAIQPKGVPENCKFIIANAEHDWEFDTEFDYIHTRMLTVGIHDWPRFFRQCWDHLAPGGWLETGEVQMPLLRVDGESYDKDSPFIRWSELCSEATAKAGIDLRASDGFTALLTRQGFINVHREDVQWPVGTWAKGAKNKLIGRLTEKNMDDAVSGLATALFTSQLSWTKQQVDDLAAAALCDIADRSNHFYYRMCLHRAQKPARA